MSTKTSFSVHNASLCGGLEFVNILSSYLRSFDGNNQQIRYKCLSRNFAGGFKLISTRAVISIYSCIFSLFSDLLVSQHCANVKIIHVHLE